MDQSQISEHYKILNINETSSTAEINAAFKKLAFKFHPDKNRTRIEWATKEMAQINIAYSSIISYRFQNNGKSIKPEEEANSKAHKKQSRTGYNHYENSDVLIERFSKIRESTNDALYKFFQYNLYNLKIRETSANSRIYNEIVHVLKKNYHYIKSFLELTDDTELTEHFKFFSEMIFNFYRASECLNVIDSYANNSDVDAYRMYKSGDDVLHSIQKEIFFDRHNRGFFRQELALTGLVRAERIFANTLNSYPESSWRIETIIKKNYTNSLTNYVNLFFNE